MVIDTGKKSVKEHRKKTAKELRKSIVKSDSTPYFTSATAPCYATITQRKPNTTKTTPYYSTMIPPRYATTPPVTSPYYVTMASPRHPPSQYSQLEHYSTPTIAPIKRSTSDNCLAVYEKIHPQHSSDKINI